MGIVLIPTPLRTLSLLCCTFVHALAFLNKEGAALLSFKSSISEDPESSFSNWNSSDPDPCSWNGITCRDGKVVSFSIPNSKLLGSLSPALGSLPSLRHINFRSNRLYGALPPGLFAASELQTLVLYGNSLSGSVPPEIGSLSYLQILGLSQNSFSDSIPATLIQCKRLKTLDLSHNNFTGPLPIGFASSFAGLEKLDLSYNRLNGSIPSDIGNLSSLEGTVDFSHNLFSGPIPKSFGNLPEKVYIDLSYNNLNGSIPHNGALENRGPAAFIGNPGLCGPPLKNPCPFSHTPPGFIGDTNMGGSSWRRGQSRSAMVGIMMSDVVAIGLIAMVFYYCYRRAISSKHKEETGTSHKDSNGRTECSCFRKDESETLSENVEQLDLISLDQHLGFDLDELLKASAFVLGKNGIGVVYKVVLEDGLTLAVRRLGEGGSQRFKEFQTEVEVIGKVRHHNIVTLRAYYWSIEEKLLIYDYIPNGNLTTAMHGRAGMFKFSPLSWDVRLKIIKGIAKGLAFLHGFSPKKNIHGELNPNNILLGVNMEPYISDFGVGRLANIAGGFPVSHSKRTATDKPQNQLSDVAVSPDMSSSLCYQPPEALKSLKLSQKWDVYSFGVILLELISGRSPVVLLDSLKMDIVRWFQFCIEENKPLSDVLDPFLAQEPEREDEIIAALKIALACVQTHSERRPSMRQVVDNLDWSNTTQ